MKNIKEKWKEKPDIVIATEYFGEEVLNIPVHISKEIRKGLLGRKIMVKVYFSDFEVDSV